MKSTFTTLLLAGLMSTGAACMTDEPIDELDLGETAQEATTAASLASRCVQRIAAKRATLRLGTTNINDWKIPTISGNPTYRTCAEWGASYDAVHGPHAYANIGGTCGIDGGQNQCPWNQVAGQTLESQVDACVDAWWAEPYNPGNHRGIMQNNSYASCGVFLGTVGGVSKIYVNANFRRTRP